MVFKVLLKIHLLEKKRINKSSFKITWNNNFDNLNEKYVLKNQSKGQNNEMKIIRKANILVKIFFYSLNVFELNKDLIKGKKKRFKEFVH